MNKLMIAMATLVAAAQALAMPTREELSKAQPLVNELMAPALEEYKSAADKVAAAASVGDRSSAFAAEAETEAAKFLLLKGAVNYYVRGEAYDKAADCIAAMQSDISNLMPDAIAEIVGKATNKISESKAPRLIAYYRAAKLQIRARNELPGLEQKLKRVKTEQLQRQYAEALAISGNWKAAYAAFAKSRDVNLAQIAEAEAKGTAANEQAAELWWNYKPEFEGAGKFFKVHAVEFYQKALENGEITGLRKPLAEKRVKEMDGVMTASCTSLLGSSAPAASGKAPSNALYCVIDISAGPTANKYPVKWLAVPPAGGFNTDEYKTTKLVLRRIEPGKFKMGGKYEVTLTKPYYIGIFETTQKQYKQVTGSNNSKYNDDGRRPVERVSWNTIRGDSTTYNWPNSANVDPSSFMGKMQTCTGLNFDLPTEAQWEYACRAGSDGEFGGTGRIDDMGWYKDNSGGRPHPAGQKQANAWGIYDMHGNVGEWCLDWKGDLLGGETDPVGSFSGSKRIWRGGCWCECDPRNCGSSARGYSATPFADSTHFGFRLCMNPEASVGVLAQGSGAPAALGKAPDYTSAKRGKSIMVKIKNGIELEFVPCPAGTFTMGTATFGNEPTNPNHFAYKHEVTISRSFWMSKYPITVEQFGAFCPIDDAFIKRNGKQGEAKAPVCLRIGHVEDYCNWLNGRFASALPRKCIFRLPTDAEWEYAFFANSTDKDDPYVRLRDGEKAAMYEICGTTFPVPVGTAGKPNAWGLYDMLGNGCHYLLDTVNGEYVKGGNRYEVIDSKKMASVWSYNESETDPLRLYVPDEKGHAARHLMRGGLYLTWAKNRGPNVYIRMAESGLINCDSDRPDRPRIWTFRVVIGPDLVSEWMAKNGKK